MKQALGKHAPARLQHGSCIASLAQEYGIAEAQWLDLSTGINPNAYPIPELPKSVWNLLPSEQDGLLQAARDYYGCESLLPVPGSQWAIEHIPSLIAELIDLEQARVLVPRKGYLEHAGVWAKQACTLDVYDLLPNEQQLAEADICVVIQPNNPNGTLLSSGQLEQLHTQALASGTLLIIDEAFLDAENVPSMASNVGKGQLIVLRSVGKFFGLAGIRLGFVAAWPAFLNALEARLSLWPIAGPTRALAIHALQDRQWQSTMKARLQQDSHTLVAMLRQTFAAEPIAKDCAKNKDKVSGCALFQTVWLSAERARESHRTLCRTGIATRLLTDAFGHIVGLRFGLPANALEEGGFGHDVQDSAPASYVSAGPAPSYTLPTSEGWQRLSRALADLEHKIASGSFSESVTAQPGEQNNAQRPAPVDRIEDVSVDLPRDAIEDQIETEAGHV